MEREDTQDAFRCQLRCPCKTDQWYLHLEPVHPLRALQTQLSLHPTGVMKAYACADDTSWLGTLTLVADVHAYEIKLLQDLDGVLS